MTAHQAQNVLKVMLVGSHPVLRHTLREIIQPEDDLVVVAEARDIPEALVAARALRPDAIVVDIALACEKDVAALWQVCRAGARPRIIMFGLTADREHVLHALRAGACGYLRTQDAAEELVTALRTACPQSPFLGAGIERKEIMAELTLERPPKVKAKVLIVEDDLDFVEIVKTTLESQHYQVLVAGGKEEGLRLCREARPDAIILDVMMPEGTEGFHFVWELRRDCDAKVCRTPILMLTSIHEKTSLRFYPEQGDGTYGPYEYLPVQDFADKPLSPNDLLERVQRLLLANQSEHSPAEGPAGA